MQVKTYNLTQGTSEWLAARGYSASDFARALNISPYGNRDGLIEQYCIGSPEPTPMQQEIFARGHIVEKLLIEWLEVELGEMFSPVMLGVDVGLAMPITASFDGINFERTLATECKTLNAAIREAMKNGADKNARLLPAHYRAQMCQQAWVAGASLSQMIFAAGELLGSEAEGWRLGERVMVRYTPEPDLMAMVEPTWRDIDDRRKVWAPKAAVLEVVEAPPKLAPLRVSVSGNVLVSADVAAYSRSLEAFAGVRRITDDATLDLAKTNKRELEAGEGMLKSERQRIIDAIPQVSDAIAQVDSLHERTRSLRLAHEKMISAAGSEVKASILEAGRTRIADRIAQVTERVGYKPDFHTRLEACIARLSSFDSMRSKVNDAVIAAIGELADMEARAAANLAAIPSGAAHLLPDLNTLVWRDSESFAAIVGQRVQAAREAEDRRIADAVAKARAKEAAEAAEAAAANAAPKAPAPSISQAAPIQPPPDDGGSPVTASAREYRLGDVCRAIGASAGTPEGVKITADMLAALGATYHTDRAAKLFAAPSLARALHCLASEIADIAAKIEAGEDI